MGKILTFIDEKPWEMATDIYIREEREDGDYFFVAKPMELVMERVEEGIRRAVPTLTLRHPFDKQFLQAVFDHCWAQGMRPEKAPVLENELDAVKRHLGDMQKLVFDRRIK